MLGFLHCKFFSPYALPKKGSLSVIPKNFRIVGGRCWEKLLYAEFTDCPEIFFNYDSWKRLQWLNCGLQATRFRLLAKPKSNNFTVALLYCESGPKIYCTVWMKPVQLATFDLLQQKCQIIWHFAGQYL